MKIVEPILFQCKLNPLALTIYVPGSKYGAINYATLERYIHNVAQTALKSGIAARNVVAIYVTDPILHTSLILGLMHLGVTTLSLSGPKPIAGITPDVILTDAPAVFKLMNSSNRVGSSNGSSRGEAPFRSRST
jgi:acyl-CoA synthetase (AMP-forming)/AMP-acid ligase II